jgi:flagellar hook protein FlgE
MASTTAFFTGLSGLSANARSLDVIGNNIANVNTTAFKSNRMMFATQFARTLSAGTAPGANSGGTNPNQIGLGVAIAGTQRNFSTGSVSPTGDPRDLAIDGNGFFIVKRGNTELYTRAGGFRQNTANQLVNVSGERLQGWGVDANFNVVRGVLTDLSIPIGTLTIAEPSRNVRISGNLNSNGPIPTRGSLTQFGPLSALPTASPAPGAGNVLQANTRLVDIADPANAASPLLQAGETIRLSGAKKGTQDIPTATFTVTSTSTVQDYLDFLNTALNINTTLGNNPDGRTPGVSLDPTTGQISVVGNIGSANSIDIEGTDLSIVSAAGTARQPLSVAQSTASDGESVLTSFIAFDSLGAPVTVNLRMVLESKTGGSGTTWRYFAESPDSKAASKIIGTGTLNFDATGRLTSDPTLGLAIDRTGTGAVSPMNFNMVFADSSSAVTALTAQTSTLAAISQDGAALGTLQSFAVGQDGVITGGFSNGLTRTLGQITVATFANPEGLVDAGGNLFAVGPNSGEALKTEPLNLGAGKVVGGALELSNVDLSQEFINLILASTGYSASSRVITTTDQLMQQLLAIGR